MPTAAAAQEAGFRPCLRCRPESSPDLDAWRSTSATVSHALKMIEGGALDEGDVASLAMRLEIGERQLRRLFRQHIGAAPVTVAQTRRVLLAKQLLHQTDLPMIEVALASGFGSVRRFNETFQHLYHRPPGELRQRRAVAPSSSPEISLLLPYRPPYDWAAMIRFLKVRALAGIEVVAKNTYSRTIELDGAAGSITVSHVPDQSALRVIVRFPHLNAMPVIIARIRRMFDLSADPGAIASVLSSDPVLAPLILLRPGLRVPGGWNGFEIAVRAVLGQQVTLEAGIRLATRIAAITGMPIDATIPGLTHVFPQPGNFKMKTVNDLGIPRARLAALAGIADAAGRDIHFFDSRRDLEETVAHLCQLPGIGEWTAQYIAMRALGESDAFLAGDVALQRGFSRHGKRLSASELMVRAECWRPWRAYAALHLWMAAKNASRTLVSNKFKQKMQ